MKELVVILGAGIMQIPAIHAAKKLGLGVCVFDKSSDSPGVHRADLFFKIDLRARDELLKCTQKIAYRYKIIGIFTTGTDFSANVAYIAEHFHLPGHSYEAACRSSNKLLMRACFLENNIPSPRFLGIVQTTPFFEICKNLCTWNNKHFPQVVVKPVDNMGSRGVVLVDSKEQLKKAITFALNYSYSKEIIIEEFMDGLELSIDALVYNNRVEIFGVADRHIYYSPYFVELGHTLPSQQKIETLNEVINIFTKAVQALGLKWGAAKGDIKLTSEGPKIGEIAARLSGGYMSGWTYPLASGINLTKHALELSVGKNPSTSKEFCRNCLSSISAEWALISIPGIVKDILFLKEANSIPFIRHCFLKIQKGSYVVFPSNNVEKCGNFIACNPESSILAQKAVRDAIRTIFIRLQPNNQETESFLFNNSSFLSHLDIYGYDHNLLSYLQIQKRFTEITNYSYTDIPVHLKNNFEITIKKGGLQGAVWFHDTYLNS